MKHRIITNGYGYRLEFQSPTTGEWWPVTNHANSPWKRKTPWQTRWLWRAQLKRWLLTSVDDWHDRWVDPLWQRLEAYASKRNDWSKPSVVDGSDVKGGS
jgi:hypothetical protein